jgi:DNA-binding NarL/FixJ family response regulator
MRELADEPHERQPIVGLQPSRPSATGRLQLSWAASCALYREALTTYAQAVQALHAKRRMSARRPTMDTSVRVFERKHLGPTRVGPAPVTPLKVAGPDLESLTIREREVAGLIARGLSNRQIAETLMIERGTVANHVAHILSKLGVANRTQIAMLLLHDQDGGGTIVSGQAEHTFSKREALGRNGDVRSGAH